jgi:hypothetical protein
MASTHSVRSAKKTINLNMGIRAVENYDASFDLNPEVRLETDLSKYCSIEIIFGRADSQQNRKITAGEKDDLIDFQGIIYT